MIHKPAKMSKTSSVPIDAIQDKGCAKSVLNSGLERSGGIKEGLKGVRVLLAEDNVIDRMVAEELLKKEGVFVILAENGRMAVRTVRENCERKTDPHAILMALHMPEWDGFQTARIIRSDPRFDEIPIVAMTNPISKEIVERCFDCGMNHYIIKPVDASELCKVLARCLAGKKPLKEGNGRSWVELRTMRPAETAGRYLRQLPGIDFETGVRRLGQNPELYVKLLRQFVQDYKKCGEHIVEAICSEDLETAKELAHGIKGVAGNLSTPRLFAASKELDAALKTKNIIAIPDLINEFCDAMDQVFDSITTQLTD